MPLTKVQSRGTENVGAGSLNIAHNGAMTVAQRGTQTGQGNSEAMTAVDRMKLFGGNTGGRLTSSQDSDAPVGFANSLKLACTTADTSIASNEFMLLEQRIEGQNLQQLKYNQSSAVATTVSFYVKGNASAQYTFALQYHLAGGTARMFTKAFAVTTSWNRITIPIIGDTQASSGSDYGIADDNLTGMNIMFWLHGGTNFSSGTHQDTAWADRDYTTLLQDSQTSFFDSTSRTFLITGLQFEIGSQASDFQHEDFGTTLAKCQRYFFAVGFPDKLATSVNFAMGYYLNSARVDCVIDLPVTMRTTPSVIASSGTNHFDAYMNGNDYFSTFDAINSASANSFTIYRSSQISGTAGDAVLISKSASASLSAEAEL